MGHPVDIHVGLRMRQRRRLLNMSTEQVANRIGLQPQQIQKYEVAENRVGASRLWDIASALDVPVDFFFKGLESRPNKDDETRAAVLTDPAALELIRVYRMLSEGQRKQILRLARVMRATD